MIYASRQMEDYDFLKAINIIGQFFLYWRRIEWFWDKIRHFEGRLGSRVQSGRYYKTS